MIKNWSSTVRLPRSSFLPRANPEHTNKYIQRCADDFYKWQATHRPAENTFRLHDGPPYANGDLHAGHALNKILKDIVLRVKVQQGRRVAYTPGWDCHGLPIELKALDATGGDKNMPALEIRKSARELALTTIQKQMDGFRSYAVMADWGRRWTTMDKDFELRQLRLFQKMVSRGLIYRRFKPVYWSPSSGTALAEAELEYAEKHVSHAAYVRFRIVKDGDSDWRRTLGLRLPDGVEMNLFALIWTTTPWTLPANRAIAVHDDLDYSILTRGTNAYIIASDCLEDVKKLSYFAESPGQVIGTVKGSMLGQLKYVNELRGKGARAQPIIHAPFVSPDSGSGLVHCAPGHGFEDYEVCLPLGIEVAAPVDKDGNFTADAYPPDPSRLKGLDVLSEGGKAVTALLGEDILDVARYRHKYPYDWRTRLPVIVRATAQWFADVAHIKEAAMEALNEVRFIPEGGRSRLEAFVKGRSEWCISRQRAWGMPIPVLYDEAGNHIMTDDSLNHIISVIEERGTDAWWSDDPEDQTWVAPSLRGQATYRRGTDTMDVWFDSGSSWTSSEYQADVYLEGSDQHRGWFQSSLLTRVAALAPAQVNGSTTQVGLSPFKTLITHGFTLDAKGRKMSKSLGNVVAPDAIMDGSIMTGSKPKERNKSYSSGGKGPDALRFWVASSDYTKDVVLSPGVVDNINASLSKVRGVLKLLLGSMQPEARTLPVSALDHMAIIQLKDTMEEVGKLYDNYEFQKVVSVLNRWIAKDLSAFYIDALKDRLYTGDGGGVLEPIFFGLLRMLAPITPVMVEEAWDHAPAWLKEDPNILHPLHQLYTDPLIDPARITREAQIREAMPVLTSAHAAILAAMELARQDKVLGSSLGCVVVIEVPPGSKAAEILDPLASELPTIFIASEVEVVNSGFVPPPVKTSSGDATKPEWAYSQLFEAYGGACKAWVLPPRKHKCLRCWRHVAEKENDLCGRCFGVVAKMGL